MGVCQLPAGGGIVGVAHLFGCCHCVLLFCLCYKCPAAKAATLDAGGVGACPHISLWFFLFASLARFVWWDWLAFD